MVAILCSTRPICHGRICSCCLHLTSLSVAHQSNPVFENLLGVLRLSGYEMLCGCGSDSSFHMLNITNISLPFVSRKNCLAQSTSALLCSAMVQSELWVPGCSASNSTSETSFASRGALPSSSSSWASTTWAQYDPDCFSIQGSTSSQSASSKNRRKYGVSQWLVLVSTHGGTHDL